MCRRELTHLIVVNQAEIRPLLVQAGQAPRRPRLKPKVFPASARLGGVFPRLAGAGRPDLAVEQLRHLAENARQLAQQGPQSGLDIERIKEHVGRYAQWVASAERLIPQHLGWSALADLHSGHHATILGFEGWEVRASYTVSDELVRQALRLDRVAADIQAGIEFFAGDRSIVVADTNSFLHCHVWDRLDVWCNAVGDGSLVLLPMRVIRELDNKKVSSNKGIARRAAKTLNELEQRMRLENVAVLERGVTLTVFLQAGVWDPDHDQEVLNVALTANAYSIEQRVAVLTDDLSMRLRARSCGLQIRQVDPVLRIVSTQARVRRKPLLPLIVADGSKPMTRASIQRRGRGERS